MSEIQSQAGISLADVYDVDGSVARLQQLETREVTLTHEMGATIFSERLSGAIRRANTGDILQSVSWNIVLTDLPGSLTRIFGVQVFTDNSGRVNDATVSIRDGPAGREIPIFAWDLNFTNVVSRIEDDGGGVATLRTLINAISGNPPNMLIHSEQRQPIDQIAFRGSSTAFGAGTVNVTMVLYIGFTHVGDISSFGLPIPGW